MINVDKNPAYPAAVEALKEEGILPRRVRLRQWAADFSGTYDLGIGNSLSGVSFKSLIATGQPITFAVNGSTEFAIAQEVSGVPEPATIVVLLPVLMVIRFRIGISTGQSRSGGNS